MRKNRLSKRNRRGFTLIEMAIVLSVIGAIVATLIGASAILQERNTTNQGVDEVGIIAGNVKAFYSGQSPTITTCPQTFATNYAAANYGVFPSEMVTGTVANNPWNPSSGTATALVDLCYINSSTQFIVRYTGLSTKACSDIVVRSSELTSGSNLQQIVVTVGTTQTTFSTIPAGTNATGAVDPAGAYTACTTTNIATTATVDWYYKLNG